MLNIFKYVLNNTITDIRSDIAEYGTLSRTVSSLKKDKTDKYKALRVENGCISVRTEIDAIGFSITDEKGSRNIDLVEYEKETYFPCSNLSESLCINTKCPHFQKNQKYMESNSAYEKALQMKRAFWDKKIAREK